MRFNFQFENNTYYFNYLAIRKNSLERCHVEHGSTAKKDRKVHEGCEMLFLD